MIMSRWHWTLWFLAAGFLTILHFAPADHEINAQFEPSPKVEPYRARTSATQLDSNNIVITNNQVHGGGICTVAGLDDFTATSTTSTSGTANVMITPTAGTVTFCSTSR
jgi:hypothetical protein